MKLEFKPNDRGNFYDVARIDFESERLKYSSQAAGKA